MLRVPTQSMDMALVLEMLFPPRENQLSLGVHIFPPTAESIGVSAQIGSGVVRGGPEVRFHEGFTRVPPGFHEGCGLVRALKRAQHAVGDIT